MWNSNIVYGKYFESFFIKYITKIAKPIFIVESDQIKVIEEIKSNTIEEYNFIIKNFDENCINQIELFYHFELEGINENIQYELLDLRTNKVIEFENRVSKQFSLGLKKEIHEYCLKIDFSNTKIEKNTKINLKISTNI